MYGLLAPNPAGPGKWKPNKRYLYKRLNKICNLFKGNPTLLESTEFIIMTRYMVFYCLLHKIYSRIMWNSVLLWTLR
jgi:hypothetical protein